MNEWIRLRWTKAARSLQFMLQRLTGRVCPPLPILRPAATAVIDGEGRRVNWTSHGDWRRGSAVVQGHMPVHRRLVWALLGVHGPCIHEWFGLSESLRVVTGHPFVTATVLRPGYFPDFLTAAYDHVIRSLPFLTDMLTSLVLIWRCVLYIGLQIFTLWQKSKVGVRIIFDGILYSKFYGMP